MLYLPDILVYKTLRLPNVKTTTNIFLLVPKLASSHLFIWSKY